jgi:hypothetical protein
MKLTIEEHKEIAMHLHAVDHHLMKVARILGWGTGDVRVPDKIFTRLQDVGEEIGAGTSPSGHSTGSILGRLNDVLIEECPDATLEVYYGSYADCTTLRMSAPDKIAED